MQTNWNNTLNWTPIIIVIFVLVFGGIGFLVYKLTKKEEFGTEESAEKNYNKRNLTRDPLSYDTMAQRLYRALKGFGTDEDTVVDVIKNLKTKDDYYYLAYRYGVVTNDNMSMIDHLFYDLSDNPKARKIVVNHLNSIGITA